MDRGASRKRSACPAWDRRAEYHCARASIGPCNRWRSRPCATTDKAKHAAQSLARAIIRIASPDKALCSKGAS
eukprot:5397886-Amphidinium_carterae.1